MVAVAEASSSKRKARKTLDHLEIHPQLGGGHIVKHMGDNYDPEPKEVKFNKEGKSQGGEHIMAHLQKHAGLPPMDAGGGYGETPTAEEGM